jgi:hypothetical protein
LLENIALVIDLAVQDMIGSKAYTAKAFSQLTEAAKKKIEGDNTFKTVEEYEMSVWANKHNPGINSAKRKSGDAAIKSAEATKKVKRASD